MRPPPSAAPRKGARRIIDIPPAILAALNAGELEAASLPEWLAIDHLALLAAVLPSAGFSPAAAARIIAATEPVRRAGVMERCRAAAAALYAELTHVDGAPTQGVITADTRWQALGRHRSDLVRSWAAFTIGCAPELDLAERRDALAVFAIDPNFGTRECAWMALRPALMRAGIAAAVHALLPWAHAAHEGLRRCATEATRPCGVWCAHWEELKSDPAPARALLDACRSDPSRYVRTSVANWLNDASKSHPAWVRRVCADWRRASRTAATTWIVHHATRTLRKRRTGV